MKILALALVAMIAITPALADRQSDLKAIRDKSIAEQKELRKHYVENHLRQELDMFEGTLDWAAHAGRTIEAEYILEGDELMLAPGVIKYFRESGWIVLVQDYGKEIGAVKITVREK